MLKDFVVMVLKLLGDITIGQPVAFSDVFGSRNARDFSRRMKFAVVFFSGMLFPHQQFSCKIDVAHVRKFTKTCSLFPLPPPDKKKKTFPQAP